MCLGTGCLLRSGALIPVHGLTHLCTYPDLYLYIPFFCFRVETILERVLNALFSEVAPVSAVLCLPACLRVHCSLPRGQAPSKKASKASSPR